MDRMHQYSSCKDCCHAVYTDKTQTGCALNKLEIFKNNINVIEAYDDDKEFYILEDAECPFKNKTNDIHIAYQIIIISNSNIDDMRTTIISAFNQNPRPCHITIIRKFADTIRPRDYVDLMQEYEEYWKWRIENIVDPIISDLSCVDLVIDFEPQPIYSIFYSGFKIPHNTFSVLNNKILHFELKAITLLGNSTGNGFTSYSSIHSSLSGNAETSYIEKLKEHIECQTLLQSISSIVPNFPR